MSILGGTFLLALLTAVAGPANSRTPSPQELAAFDRGLHQFQSGDARGAEQTWKAGYAIGRDPAFLVRIAEAEEKAGAPTEALQTYERYLRESPNASDREDIEARLKALSPHRPKTEVPNNAQDIPGELGGASKPNSEGQATAPAGPAAEAGATPPAAVTGVLPPSKIIQVPDHQENPEDELRAFAGQDPPRSSLNVAAWSASGLTVALLGTGMFFGASASSKEGDLNRWSTFRDPKTGARLEYATIAAEYEEAQRVGARDNKLAKAFFLSAAVSAAAATTLFIVDAFREPTESDTKRGVAGADRASPSLALSAAVGLGSVFVTGSFQ